MWTGALSSGYGVIGRDGGLSGNVGLHRLMWEATYGNHPCLRGPMLPGIQVCHRCDVNYPKDDITYRSCCNPEHLFLATAKGNHEDMYAKGRNNDVGTPGAANAHAKLTDAGVLDIRRRVAEGVRRALLATEYGVSIVMIGNIVNRKSWTHVA